VDGLRRVYNGHENLFRPHRMDLLGGVGQTEARFASFGDSVNLDAILVHSLRRACNRPRNHFGRT
jgi:hypothetical protein